MKILFLILLSSSILVAEPLTLKLDYNENEEGNYSKQIQSAFTKLLVSNSNLAKEFTKFEAPPPEDARGRYSGEPTIRAIVISEDEHVNFRDSGGTKVFKKMIALYYRFDEGMHRGRETSSGFFAIFTVNGNLTYLHLKNDEFKLTKANVVAQFNGFNRTLTAPKPDVNN